MKNATNKEKHSIIGAFSIAGTYYGNKWKLKRVGSTRAIKIYQNKQDAIKRGAELAKKNLRDLYIHADNGNVIEKRSYRPN